MVAFRQHDIEDRQNGHLATLRGFIALSQFLVIQDEFRDQNSFYVRKVEELSATIAGMPETHRGRKEDPVAYLHYFHGDAHYYITEKDAGAPGDEPEDFQSQAYGLMSCPPSYPEMGYISIPQLLAFGAEIDLHWTPKRVSQISH